LGVFSTFYSVRLTIRSCERSRISHKFFVLVGRVERKTQSITEMDFRSVHIEKSVDYCSNEKMNLLNDQNSNKYHWRK